MSGRPQRWLRVSLGATVAVVVAWLGGAVAQDGDERLVGAPTAEFHFARLVYRDSPNSRRGRFGFRGGGAWATDYADAEFHVMQGIGRLTRVDTAPVDIDGNGGRLIRLDDDRVFDYPWLYAVEVGQWYLPEDEAAKLREYLDRGGFLMVDDFWGEDEWETFYTAFKMMWPDRDYVELELEHEIFHIVFDLPVKPQIPSVGIAMGGRSRGMTHEWGKRGSDTPHFRAVYDDKKRMCMLVCFNTDLGDGWEEEGTDPWYFREFSEKYAYPLGINILIYALTH